MMRFLQTPGGFVTSVMLAIFVLGLGLTAPIWLILAGEGPVDALNDGTPAVVISITGLVITIALGIAAQRLRKPTSAVFEDFGAEPVDSRRRDRIVHIITVLMFLVPFLTILLGLLFGHVIDADSRGHF